MVFALFLALGLAVSVIIARTIRRSTLASSSPKEGLSDSRKAGHSSQMATVLLVIVVALPVLFVLYIIVGLIEHALGI
jgi:hypothetical protein